MFRKFLSELFFNTSLGNGFYSDISAGTFAVLIIFIILSFLLIKFSEYIKVELIQDKVSLLDSLNVGDEVNVLINIKGRKWEDKEGNIRYFNSIQGWKIESENQGINQETPNEAESQESDDSDLPF